MDERIALLTLVLALLCGCGGNTSLRGDGDAGDTTSPDLAMDPVTEPAPDIACDPLPELPLADGLCCPDPLVLDPTRGICVDTTGRTDSCDAPLGSCSFGQRCEHEAGFVDMGDHCHVPCDGRDAFLCPGGMVCDPYRCCDIPESGCVPDRCEPPLLRHMATGECTSVEGLGMDCTSLESCNPGQTCLSWEGISGETFWTCEVECLVGRPEEPRLCPNGYRCVDWDDGPQNVCEPITDMRGCDDPNALFCGYPEKFDDGLDRTNVCSDCQGTVFCFDAPLWYLIDDIESYDYYIAEFVRDHGRPDPGLCGPSRTGWALPFRTDVDDCPCLLPSDLYWTIVCIVAHQDIVTSVYCLPPE